MIVAPAWRSPIAGAAASAGRISAFRASFSHAAFRPVIRSVFMSRHTWLTVSSLGEYATSGLHAYWSRPSPTGRHISTRHYSSSHSKTRRTSYQKGRERRSEFISAWRSC